MQTTLASRLTALRKAADISQRELARLAGVSPSYPFHIETEKVHQIGVEIAGKLARVLGCSVEHLLLGIGEPPDAGAVRQAADAAAAEKGAA